MAMRQVYRVNDDDDDDDDYRVRGTLYYISQRSPDGLTQRVTQMPRILAATNNYSHLKTFEMSVLVVVVVEGLFRD